MGETMKCELCGEPMPQGEEMFKFHGYSGPCPAPPLPRKPSEVEQLRAELAAARAQVEAMTPPPQERWVRMSPELVAQLQDVPSAPLSVVVSQEKERGELVLTLQRRYDVEQMEESIAAVRKVEEWEGLRGTRIKWVEAPREPQSEWRAWSWGLRATANPRIVATGDSIIALGRALAAQEGE